MRALLDENIHVGLARELRPQIDVFTVQQQGWSGIKNGQLLALAEVEFDLFITMDRGLEFQQDLAQFDISIMLLRAPSNRLMTSNRLSRSFIRRCLISVPAP